MQLPTAEYPVVGSVLPPDEILSAQDYVREEHSEQDNPPVDVARRMVVALQDIDVSWGPNGNNTLRYGGEDYSADDLKLAGLIVAVYNGYDRELVDDGRLHIDTKGGDRIHDARYAVYVDDDGRIRPFREDQEPKAVTDRQARILDAMAQEEMSGAQTASADRADNNAYWHPEAITKEDGLLVKVAIGAVSVAGYMLGRAKRRVAKVVDATKAGAQDVIQSSEKAVKEFMGTGGKHVMHESRRPADFQPKHRAAADARIGTDTLYGGKPDNYFARHAR